MRTVELCNNEPILLVFDFDECLYGAPEGFFQSLRRGTAHCNQFLSDNQWDYGTAHDVAYYSYQDRGHAFETVCNIFNRPMAEGHMVHHLALDYQLEPDPDLISAFEALDYSRVFPMVLTHASRCFLDRKMPELGIDRFIDRNMRIAHNDYDFELKSHSNRPFELAIKRAEQVTGLQFKAENIWMFEDSYKNLRIPKEMGWNTVLVDYFNPTIAAIYEPYIDYKVYSPAAILKQKFMPKFSMNDNQYPSLKNVPRAVLKTFQEGRDISPLTLAV